MQRIPSLSWDDCRLLVESVVDYAILMLDPAGHVATWNIGAQKIKGYDAAEIIGHHFSVFYTDEDRAAGKPELLLASARERGRVEDEGWRVRKDGTRFWADVIITALYDAHGTLRGYGKVTRDLTARRAAEEKLRQAEQRFHHLVDAITDYAVFILDEQGNVVTWNPGAERTKGYRADEIIGRHFSIFYTPEDRAANKPQKILEAVAATGRFEDESERVRKDGSRFWANVVITALRDEQGKLTGFAKVTRDLTERRRLEQEQVRHVREGAAQDASLRSMRSLIDNLPELAWTALPDGSVDFYNQRWFDFTGTSPRDSGATDWTSFVEPGMAPAVASKWKHSLSTGEPFEMEVALCKRDKTSRWFMTRVRPLREPDGVLSRWVGTCTDITQSVKTRRDLEAANRTKDEFLAIVSHELRTPLNAIAGWASILKQRELEPTVAKAVEVIDRNANAQVKIIEDILDVSRIVTGNLRLEPEGTDMVAIVKQALDVVRPSAVAKQVSLELETPEPICPLVADPARLQQVAWNLISNAVKFTDRGGSVRVTVEQVGSSAVLRVSDTGAGVAPEFLPFLFDRFRQGDSSTTRRHGGLGLGLALVRHIVELHGGKVSAASEGLGKGSTLTVTLPIRAVVPIAEEGASASGESPSSLRSDTLNGVRVLVVDDDADARELVQTSLAHAGATVCVAPSAPTGFEMFQQVRPHVVISDIGMPNEDGLSFIRRIRALSRAEGGATPAIALTAFARNVDRTRAVSAGFTSHVGKPVNPHDLVAAVASLAMLVER